MCVNRDALREFTSVLGHRWDRVVLSLLIATARRRRDLVQLVRNDDGEHISDAVLTEALRRLERQGLVEHTKTGAQHAMYNATDEGRRNVEHLRQIDEFAAALRRNGAAGSTQSPGTHQGVQLSS